MAHSICAFCQQEATMTGEHIWSDWVNRLLGQHKYITYRKDIYRTNPIPETYSQWITNGFNLRAKVVCKECNNGWMSDLENTHAKPVITRMVLSQEKLFLSEAERRSLAAFAFKVAVVADHLR